MTRTVLDDFEVRGECLNLSTQISMQILASGVSEEDPSDEVIRRAERFFNYIREGAVPASAAAPVLQLAEKRGKGK